MTSIRKYLEKYLPSSSVTTHRMFESLSKKVDSNDRKIKFESNYLYLMCMANQISRVHQDTFAEYKDKLIGKKAVIVGAGPTLKMYEPIPDAVHICVNGTYRAVNPDYYFVQDFEGEGSVFAIEEIKKLNCPKFVGHYIKRIGYTQMHAEQFVERYVGAKPYYVYDYGGNKIDFPISYNLDMFPIVDNSSSIFAAMEFGLFMHPSELYVVGCDCSYNRGQHFDGSKGADMDISTVKKNWLAMKEHIDVFFPDIRVASVNPVGLRGLFEDIYTEKYMESEIFPNN